MNIRQVRNELEEYGEIAVVLESGVEYELHLHDTTCHSSNGEDHGIVETEGIKDGEYQIARFPSAAIEHFHFHKEN